MFLDSRTQQRSSDPCCVQLPWSPSAHLVGSPRARGEAPSPLPTPRSRANRELARSRCGLSLRHTPHPHPAALPAGPCPSWREAGDDTEGHGAEAPLGLGCHLFCCGAISRQDYQCPSESAMHENRKSWDKILHLPSIVIVQLFSTRRRHPAASLTLLCRGCPHPPRWRRGAGEAGLFCRAPATGSTLPDTWKGLDHNLVFQGKSRGLSKAMGRGGGGWKGTLETPPTCRVTEAAGGHRETTLTE